jgi:hypothetical protein
MRGHPMFRAVAADGELLELSERIFGELAGTGDFVAECTGMRAAGSPARRHAGRRDSSTRISQS